MFGISPSFSESEFRKTLYSERIVVRNSELLGIPNPLGTLVKGTAGRCGNDLLVMRVRKTTDGLSTLALMRMKVVMNQRINYWIH